MSISMATTTPQILDVEDYEDRQLREILKAAGDDTKDRAPELREFLEAARKRLEARGTEADMQTSWFENEYPAQSDTAQMAKTTDRIQKVQVFPNARAPIQRERLGVADVHNTAVAQGTMNPTLRNTTFRNVVVDSRFRPIAGEAPYTKSICPEASSAGDSSMQTTLPRPTSTASSTSFTVNLTETLNQVLSIKLQSIQIPSTWYAFSRARGNTGFMVSRPVGENSTLCEIPEGNYTPQAFVEAVEAAIQASITGSTVHLEMDPASGVLKGYVDGGDEIEITYYSEVDDINPCKYACAPGARVDRNIGRNLGMWKASPQPPAPDNHSFRIPVASSAQVIGDAPVYADGPPYFVVMLDDFNQNRLNKGIVGTLEDTSAPSLPSYATPDVDCSGNDIIVPPCNPRRLTQAELYTWQEVVNERRNRKHTGRLRAPTTSNVLAVIQRKEGQPVTSGSTTLARPMVETSSVLQLNTRTYFGPVTIDRLKVELRDADGDLVDLHGRDWNMVLRVEQLYQF